MVPQVQIRKKPQQIDKIFRTAATKVLLSNISQDYVSSLNSLQLEAIDKVRSCLKSLVYRENTEDTIQDHLLNIDIMAGRDAA